MQKAIIIGASIIIGFVIHAYILNSNVQQTAGEHCVEQMKKTDEYKNKNPYDKESFIAYRCASYSN